jgi:hypothetical protein
MQDVGDVTRLYDAGKDANAARGHVPDSVDWTAELDIIKARLAAIESAAAAASIPQLVIEELNSAIDHCRKTLWAAKVSTLTTYGGSSAIVAVRIKRVQEMCCRIREDVTAGRIWKDTPGIAACHASLADTQEAFRSLFDHQRSR